MLPLLDPLMGVLDHHDRRIDHRADRDRDPAKRHDVGVDALQVHHDESGQNAKRQRDDGDQRRAHVPQEQRADDRDDDELFGKLVGEVLDRSVDKVRAVIRGDDRDAAGQALLQDLELVLHRLNSGTCVRSRAQDDDSACDLAVAIEFCDAAAHFRAKLDRRHFAKRHGHAARSGAQWHSAEVVERLQIARSAHHIFGLAELENRTAGFLIGLPDRGDGLSMGNAEASQLHRVEHHLVLLDHAADAGDLGNAGQALELVAQEPVLERSQLREIVPAGAVDQRILVHPANAGRVGPDRASRGFGQPALHLVEIFEDARSRPIKVGAVLEDDIDEAVPEKGIAAHGFRAGHREHRRCERIGDLVFDNLRGLARIARADDHLRVAEVG